MTKKLAQSNKVWVWLYFYTAVDPNLLWLTEHYRQKMFLRNTKIYLAYLNLIKPNLIKPNLAGIQNKKSSRYTSPKIDP